jgi:hypothetical protein
MGTTTKVIYVIFRLAEFFSACIVTGILGYFVSRVELGGGHQNGRVIYTEVMAVLGILISAILLPPFTYAFTLFAVDG